MAGEGDHREAIEHEIARRGLAPRVLMHGHVSEEKKLELLQRAWVNMTASSAEGWCLTVMEAAACGDAERGDGRGRAARVDRGRRDRPARPHARGARREDAADRRATRELRERLGERPRERAREFTWERTGRAQPAPCSRRSASAQAGARRRSLRGLARTDTGRAAGLAAVGDRGQRDRARVHDRLRPAARRQRLRLARRAAVRLHHPDGPRLGPADRRGAGREHGRGRRRPARGRRGAPLAPTSAAGHRRRRRCSRSRCGTCSAAVAERGRGLGGGRRAAHGDALDARVGRARRAPGAPALQARGLEHHRRGGRAARLRAAARGHRARRDRRVPRQRRCRSWRSALRAAPGRCSGGCPHGEGDAAARPARRRVGARDRPDAAVRAPGGARDRGEARGRRRRRRLLRGGRGGGQGDHLGGRGARDVPAARGGAARARRRGRAPDPAANACADRRGGRADGPALRRGGRAAPRARCSGTTSPRRPGALPWLGLAMALLACAYLVRAVPARHRAHRASSACSARPRPWRCCCCSRWAPTSPASRSRCSASSCVCAASMLALSLRRPAPRRAPAAA